MIPVEVSVSDDGKAEIWLKRSVRVTQKMEHNFQDVTVLNRETKE